MGGKEENRGSILILVLLIITILVTIILELQRKNLLYQVSSTYMINKWTSQSLALSGLALAKTLLFYDRKEGNKSDHLGEIWARAEDQTELFLPDIQKGKIIFKINDEQAKFPINYLIDSKGNWQEEYCKAFFNLLTGPAFKLDSKRAQNIINAIKDWLDKDEQPETEEGFEQDFYNQHGIEIKVRNGPIQYLAELQYIPGITKKLYAGEDGRPGLKDLLTVYTNGQVNINTASLYVLAALIDQGEDKLLQSDALHFARIMISYRKENMHFDKLSSTQWYNDLPGALNIHFFSFITTQSSYFSVLSIGKVGQTMAKIWTVWKLKKVKNNSLEFKTLFIEFS